MYEDRVTYFAETDYRNKRTPFGIKASDRTRHMYVIGKTGMGKSTLLENMAVQDIRNGEGLAFLDPHGSSAELLLEYVPKDRIKDVIYFAPFDTDNPISFNIMEDVGKDKRHLVANGLMAAFKKIWQDAWSSRMEYILTNTLLALIEFPDATLLGVNRMYSDKEFRKKVVDNIADTSVKSFWVDEFSKYTDRYTQEATPAIQNKVGQFTGNPLIRNIIGQPKSTIDFREIMDNKKIFIANLSKGRMGELNADLLGSMLVTKIYLAAMSRADVVDTERNRLPNFNFFVDEFQSFANESFSDILSEARKYKLNLTIAHQYVEQMPEEVRAAVFGNVGSMIVFRVGSFDAELFEKEFAPRFTAEDIVNLGFAQIYLRLMIDGIGSQPFSAVTLPPLSKPEHSLKQEIIESSRSQFAKPRGQVEQEIGDWFKPMHIPSGPPKNGNGAPQAGSSTGSRAPRDNRDTREPRKAVPARGTENARPYTPVPPKPQQENIAPVQPKPRFDPKVASPQRSEPREKLPARPQESVSEKSVSLSSLKKTPDVGGEKKNNSLKDALMLAIKEKEERAKSEEPKKTVHVPAEAQKTEPTQQRAPREPQKQPAKEPEPTHTTQPTKTKEIPEDVLRAMLKVKEE